MSDVVGLQHFAAVGHTATMFLYECIKPRYFRSLFTFNCVLPLLHYYFPTLETYPTFAITSPWQQRRNFLLLICKECSAEKARLGQKVPTLGGGTRACNNFFQFIIFRILPNFRGLV